ncbi:MAG: hypothetical protein RMK89_13065, partial [Armatimonadota bacterium]|nr:hypothetical protein [Armatimonadota bacterium]MDW8144379.1 hypothetical protein [Armatimonadota bacterium]
MSVELLSILDKLEKPLTVEEKTGCRNFAVIGGFDRYMVAWAKRAMEVCDGDDLKQLFSEMVRLFEGYVSADLTERRRRILQARSLLTQARKRVSEKTRAIDSAPPSSTKVQPTPELAQLPKTESEAEQLHAARVPQRDMLTVVEPFKQIQPRDESKPLQPEQLPQRAIQTPRTLPTSNAQPLESVARSPLPGAKPSAPIAQSQAPSPLSLADPVRYLKGVGPQRAKLLKRLGIETIGDLLHFYPRRYEDRRNLKTLAEVVPGERVVVQVQVVGNPFTEERKHLLITKVPVGDATGRAFLVWFNQPYMERKFHIGQRFFVFSKATQVFGQLTFQTPEIEEITGDANLQVGRLVPVYPLTEGLSQNFVRTLVQETVARTIDRLDETLPEGIRHRYSLMPLKEALQQIHFPENEDKLESARRRIVFDEFLTLQLVLALRKK